MRKLVAVTAILVCLTAATASASDWNVANGLWSNPGSWNPVAVPNGTNANIANAGTATLQSAVPNITTLQLTNGSGLVVNYRLHEAASCAEPRGMLDLSA